MNLNATQVEQLKSHRQCLHKVHSWTREQCDEINTDLAELATQPNGAKQVADYLAASAINAKRELEFITSRGQQ